MIDPDLVFNLTMPGAYEATYWPQGGDPVETVILIDRDVELLSHFDSGVAEKRTQIVLRYDQVGAVQRGDKVTLPDETFEVQDEVANDQFAVTVAVK